LCNYLTLFRDDIYGNHVKDIRGFYKYKFFLGEEDQVYLKLQKTVDDKEGFTICLSKQTISIEQPLLHKYGEKKKEKWQEKKLDIKSEKAQDIFSLRGYCKTLSMTDLEYWYPMPKDESMSIEEIAELEMEENMNWLEKRIISNTFEETLLDEIQQELTQ